MPTQTRRPLVHEASSWPFWRPGSNPVAQSTPPAVEKAATAYRADGGWEAEQALLWALRHSPGWHRAGDLIVCCVWHQSGPKLGVKRAFSDLPA